ncbi:HAD family hydrolase [Salidesulfovibrio onnuriiensis]|uniref:HAD family hydrolase n=1 Tax=Salidesulfovibrio onnuriiensis TaxID=2583823 RepID=UPI00202B6B1A|nr:HAD family hydrolase [Salidesulfovibrio onnuriiensis]
MLITNDLMRLDVFENIGALVFDCDGVLIDSKDSNNAYYNRLREHIGLPPMSEEDAAYCHCHTTAESLERIIPEDKMGAIREFQSRVKYRDLLPGLGLKRMDGLQEFLWWLRDCGFPLAINTSRTDTMDLVLELMDLEGFFYPVVTSSDVRRPKPHPEPMYQAMNKIGARPGEVVFIGDSIVDQRCARAAGVRFWAYRNPGLEADLHITDYWTLRRCMQRAYPGTRVLY